MYEVEANEFYDHIAPDLGITADDSDEEIADLAQYLDDKWKFDDNGEARKIIGTFEYLKGFRDNLHKD